MSERRLNTMTCSRLLLVVLAAFLLGSPIASRANTPQNITAGELSRLPAYCPDSQSFSPRGTPDSPTEKQRHWVALMGTTFWAVHHYCWALVNVNRADRAALPPAERRYLFQWAIQDCYYVINLATPDFPLMPEVLTRVGQYYVELERYMEAFDHFERAKTLKPDYWPPYVAMADLNAKLGRTKVAVDILNAALVVMPDEPQLQTALKRISSGPGSGRTKRTPSSAR